MEVGGRGPRIHRRGFVLFNTFLGVVLLGGILVLLNILGRTRFVRVDLTELKELSLSRATLEVLGDLEDVLAIQVYLSDGMPEVYRSYVDQVRELLQEYRANGKGNLRVEFRDPSADPRVEDLVRGLGIEPGSFETIKKDRRAVELLYFAIGVFYRDRHEAINLAGYSASTWSRILEYELTQAIVKVTTGKPIVLGWMGEANPPPEAGKPPVSRNPQFFGLREALLKQFDIVNVDLRDGKPVPEKVDTLLVIRPDRLSEREVYEIDQFVMRGGKALFFVDRWAPSPSASSRPVAVESGLLGLLEHYGIAVEGSLVKDTRCNVLTAQRPLRTRDGKVVGQVPVQLQYMYAIRATADGLDRSSPIVAGMEAVSFLWASPLRLVPSQIVGKRVWELARSSADSWIEETPESLAPDPSTPVESPANADTGPRLLAAALVGKFDSYFDGREIPKTEAEKKADEGASGDAEDEGDTGASGNDPDRSEASSPTADSREGRETIRESPATRILVVGDADFVSDGVAQSQGQAYVEGVVFVLNAVDWFTLDSALIDIRSRGFVDRSLREVSDATKGWVKGINIVGIPLLVALFGIVRFLARGRGRRPVAIGRTPGAEEGTA